MTDASWTGNLRCPRCGNNGEAVLSEISRFNNSFDFIPEGFKIVEGPFGRDFQCKACSIPVMPK